VMCGRYTLFASPEEVAGIFNLPLPKVEDVFGGGPRYNIAPASQVAVVRKPGSADDREVILMRWGLVPSWAKDSKSGPLLINARGETVADKPAFRASFRSRRCLVIADGYFEWQKLPDRKQPFFFQVDNGALFAFAGIWDRWEPSAEGADAIVSCSIITTRANDLSKPVHERMPVVLSQESWDTWIRPAQYGRTLQHTLKSLISPFPNTRMSAVPVNTVVNNARNDLPDCIEAIGPPLEVAGPS